MLRGFSNLASSLNRPVSVLSVSQHLKFHPTIIPSSLINSFIVQQINFRALHQVQLKCMWEKNYISLKNDQISLISTLGSSWLLWHPWCQKERWYFRDQIGIFQHGKKVSSWHQQDAWCKTGEEASIYIIVGVCVSVRNIMLFTTK